MEDLEKILDSIKELSELGNEVIEGLKEIDSSFINSINIDEVNSELSNFLFALSESKHILEKINEKDISS